MSRSARELAAGWPSPPLIVVAVLSIVALGNALWVAQPDWKILRAGILWVGCLAVLVDRVRLGRELASVNETSSEDQATGVWWMARPPTVALLAALLFLVAIAGDVRPNGGGIARNLRFLLLTPTCVLLLYEWRRARDLLISRWMPLRQEDLRSRSVWTLEPLLLDVTWTAVCALATLAIGNAMWGNHDDWLTARPVVTLGLFLGVLWRLHVGIGRAGLHVRHLIRGEVQRTRTRGRQAEIDERRRLHSLSRDWAEQHDDVRGQLPITRNILEALDLAEGMSVADVGAGAGYFALEVAERVGPRGRVIATDISPLFVGQLRDEVQRRGMRHLQVTLVEKTHPLPQANTFDRILLSNVYLFNADDPAQGRAWLEQFAHALRRNGLLVLFNEFVHDMGWVSSPEWPPLAAPEPDAGLLIEWSRSWFDVEANHPLPPPRRALGTHERPGYLVVLKRR